ncbi:MAG: hypothetical protein QGI24_08310 [Kiritimatiellia bacterium]|nr:hypothetical protein [Kiritimatiellia bacterium]MDP6848776.1 hypothetical protein [Kiritimatiellia bacterium]
MKNARASLDWARTCYGADLQEDCLVVVRAERTRSGVRCTQVSSDDAAFRSDLEKGVPCIGCVPAKGSFVRWLEAPFTSAAKTKRVLPTLLDIELPFPLSDCTYAFLDELTDEEGKKEILSVAARVSDMDGRLDGYRRHDCDPMVMDQEGLAIWSQGLTEVPPEGDGVRAHLHLEKDNATLVIGKGSRLIGIHALTVADAASHAFRLLRARFDQGTGIQWIWSGRDAGNDDSVLPIRERLADWPGTSVTVDDPDSFLARAICTRALSGATASCNLRSGALMHGGLMARHYRSGIVAAVATLLAGVALCGINLAWRGKATSRETSIDEEFSRLADELAGYHVAAKGQHACDLAEESVKSRQVMLDPFVTAFDTALSRRLLAVMQCGKNNKLRYSELSMTAGNAKISGDSETWSGANVLVTLLENTGSHARLDRQDANNEGRIPFGVVAEGGHE